VIVIVGCVAVVVLTLAGLQVSHWLEAERTRGASGPTANNMRQIALGIIQYADQHRGDLPSAAIMSKDGKPLYSWRVAILPYIEEQELYDQFNLEEAWDSPHNLALLGRMPNIFAARSDVPKEPGMTYVQLFVGGGAAFERERQVRYPDGIPDGPS